MTTTAWFGIILGLFAAVILAADNNTTAFRPDWYDDGTIIAQRDGGNFISGSGITVTSADNPSNNRVDITIATTGLVTSAFAEMTDADNVDAYTVNAQSDFHAYHTNGLNAGALLGWTFDAGGAGTSFAVSGVTDQGGGEIEVTTNSAHGLAVSDLVSITNTTDYNASYVVNAIPSTTTFQVTATFVSSQAGTLDQGGVLIAGSGAAGTYYVTWAASITTATNDETLDFHLTVNGVIQTDTNLRRTFGTAGDLSSIAGSAIIDINASDSVALSLANTDSSGNLTIRNFSLGLFQI